MCIIRISDGEGLLNRELDEASAVLKDLQQGTTKLPTLGGADPLPGVLNQAGQVRHCPASWLITHVVPLTSHFLSVISWTAPWRAGIVCGLHKADRCLLFGLACQLLRPTHA
jgi:hypothetical protein